MGITVFEVGPRDGLQNETRLVSLSDKIFLVKGLIAAGLKEIEIGSFVRKDLVKQMADTDKVISRFKTEIRKNKKRLWALVPNQMGLDQAIESKVKNIAVFTAVSETFVQKNIRMSVSESLSEFATIIKRAKKHKMKIRGYLSTAFACPYEGTISPKKALKMIENLAKLGVYQVSIGDTIGVATPRQVEGVVKPALQLLGSAGVAVHFHDTTGMAVANSLRSLDLGVKTFDSSAGGLGGCPYAPGAKGNLATEDLVYLLNGLGVKTGINFRKLCETSLEFSRKINRPLSSKALDYFFAQGKKNK